MTVIALLKQLPDEFKPLAKPLAKKASETGILNEQVDELGNDQWLADALNINIARVIELCNPQPVFA